METEIRIQEARKNRLRALAFKLEQKNLEAIESVREELKKNKRNQIIKELIRPYTIVHDSSFLFIDV